ncbi:dorsal-ventral patterning tolloid-like protein 1 [Centruroides sculpturatus]|uniref:dorsal-ventral patterning tolloid-like protein 1 n=1 Tax=Centruroides sculpturatus TaxID=218467 RepID=UPI000C6DD93D|nr:dorsal-ventral patterning tolloid-like protein 1 [Centruroides sculpturatus]
MIYNIRYPWSYYYKESCNVFINAPENYAISLYFQEFHGSYRNAPANCENSGLEVHNGSDISAPLLGIFCSRTPNPIFSSSNNLLLRIRPQNYLKFVIMYSITDQGPGCGGNFTTINGTFTSPRFPGFYNKTSECRWYISVVGEHTVSLKFDVFELNSTIGCTSNYVEVYNTHDELESNKVSRYCGNDRPGTITSDSNGILVKLVTNSTNNLSGFKAHFFTNSVGRPLRHVVRVNPSSNYDYY